ncbi:hypothetical protein J2Z48_002156 [Croceifilum oryzae]|uniref:Uncharacterized protein n=1 Tax=Croceifilum oryzae TaxID=1553429 RepID=A0AAJ1WQX1_9BACL|nr:hypothetical protein [Croceifilum oryzae]MDQ0417972.1 hypothetical protein [Croceifilum oryzae]
MKKLIENWHPYFGSYDCLLNSISWWLSVQSIDVRPLVKCNWNLYVSGEHDQFGGSIPDDALCTLLPEVYSVSIQEITNFSEVPYEEVVILPIDAFHLPYLKESFQLHHQLHYVAAYFWTDGTVEIYDPYFLQSYYFREESCKEYWLRFQKPVLRLYSLGTNSAISPSPYLSRQPFERIYQETEVKLIEKIHTVLKEPDPLQISVKFQRYFGCFRSIYIARKKYFETLEHSSFEHISSLWLSVERSYMRLMVYRERGIDSVIDSIQKVIEAERTYLRQIDL